MAPGQSSADIDVVLYDNVGQKNKVDLEKSKNVHGKCHIGFAERQRGLIL